MECLPASLETNNAASSARIPPSLCRPSSIGWRGVLPVLFALAFTLTVSAHPDEAISNSASPAPNSRSLAHYANLPLSFEPNRGQTDPQVNYLARGQGYTVFLTPSEAVFSVPSQSALEPSRRRLLARHKARPQSHAGLVRIQLLNANVNASTEAVNQLPGRSNYFTGNDPGKWKRDIPQFSRVRYSAVYPGVDLVYYGNQRQLEYDFVLAPGADAKKITMEISGPDKIKIDAHGNLVLQMGAAELCLKKPSSYQRVRGQRRSVESSYVLNSPNRVEIELGSYDKHKALVIDPTLVYSTYVGGSGDDGAFGITVRNGQAYITGFTSSINFPVHNAFRSNKDCCEDVFVSKLDIDGDRLIYSTFLGSGTGQAIAVDSLGHAFVTGETLSSDFPVFKAIQSINHGVSNAFITKLNQAGNALLYSTYLGGGGFDLGATIAVDKEGNAYVAGDANSSDFPVKNALQPHNGGGIQDAFVAKLSAGGQRLVYSTFLGGERRGRPAPHPGG